MAVTAGHSRVVTVFGGGGFVGRYVVRRLARDGWRVRIASRRPDRDSALRPMGVVGQVTPIYANILDEATVAAAVRGADAAVNLVGVLAERGRQSFAALHVEGAQRIARASAAAGVGRLVHVSALGAAADSPSDYARSKAAGEQAVRAAFPSATILRPSVIFGPEDTLFNRFATLARLMPALPLYGGGHTRFQPVYVVDVAEAAWHGVTDAATAGRTYELGGPRIYTFKELMQLTLQQIRRRRLLVPVPFWVGDLQARLLGLLPSPPITRDQIALLRRDNVVAPGAPGLAELGIAPHAAEVILPTYLDRFRVGGRWAAAGRSAQ